ncbi:hypothetical protein KA013_04315 [Patescibacteria group bacterium]|nr:hypothetical protein [Patescibacteria group bacterium]
MRKVMLRAGYEEDIIARVEKLIMDTTFDDDHEASTDLLGGLLCDADMSHLADKPDEFEEKVKNLYMEYKACGLLPKRMMYEDRYRLEPTFLQKHRYHTGIAKFLYGDQDLYDSYAAYLENSRKGRNISYILKRIKDEVENKDKKKKRIQP